MSERWYPDLVDQALEDPQIWQSVSVSLPGKAPTRKTAAYWNWKHVQNPFGRSLGYVGRAVEDSSIIAVRCFLRWAFVGPNGQRVEACRAVDASTHPSFRRLGIFEKLTELSIAEIKANEIAILFNTPNSAMSTPGYLKMGWRRIGVVPLYLRPRNVLSLAWKLGLRRFRRSPSQDAASRLLQEFTTEELELVASHEAARRKSGGLRTPRDGSYLHWRYCRQPNIDYEAVRLFRDNRLLGLAVFRRNVRYGLDEVVLTELFARDATPSILVELLRLMRKTVHCDYIIAHFATGSLELAALRRTLFLKMPQRGINLFVGFVSDEASAFADQRNWDVSLGDLELF